LCGRLVPLSHFDPQQYQDDIQVVDMQSLGRARGFAVTAEYSALDDRDLMDAISRRLRALLRVIEGGEEHPLEREDGGLEETVEELEDEVADLRSELEEAKKRIREYESDDESQDHDALLEKVNEALGEVYEEGFDDLGSAVEALIEEYYEALEEAEDEA
jgi:regulator of replication initiation timing